MSLELNKNALIIVDVQKGFVRKDLTDHVPVIVARLLQEKGSCFANIFLTQFINSPSSNFYRLLDWRAMRSSPETDLHPIVLDAVSGLNYQVIQKETYGCSHLSTLLQEDAISAAVICGIDTEACVMNIAMGLFDQGFEVKVWSKGCASTAGEKMNLAALDIMKRTLGKSQVIGSLS